MISGPGIWEQTKWWFLDQGLSWGYSQAVCRAERSAPRWLTHTMPAEDLTSSPHGPFLVCVCSVSHVWLFVTLWTVSLPGPLSLGFPRQEYWSELTFPSPGESSQPRDRTQVSCAADTLPSGPLGKPSGHFHLRRNIKDYGIEALPEHPWNDTNWFHC